jgi:hypothetical protein
MAKDAGSIPPIPTLHAGVLFRSRLEARYAIFFDELDIKWEYETERFSSGRKYLPDFVVFARLGIIWAEVKPSWRADPEGVQRFQQFVLWRPMPSRAALLVGIPEEGNSVLIYGGDPGADDPMKGPWDDDTQEWRPCPSGHHFDLTHPGTFRAKFVEDGCEPSPGNPGEARIDRAFTKARSARFSSAKAA